MNRPIPRSFQFSDTQTTTPTVGHLPLILAFAVSLASTLAWKITDVDFAAHIGAKQLTSAYSIIGCFLILSGLLIAYFRKTKSPERIFIRLQQHSWTFFLLLGFIEMQLGISSAPLGIFSLKVMGHVYSSVTLLTFWMMYDPYDPVLCISKKTFTLLLTAGYLGVATSGVIFNQLELIGSSSFIPIIGLLSFIVWFLANLCHPKAATRKQHASHETNEESKSQKRHIITSHRSRSFSRSTLFLIFGSVLLNVLASSTEYSVIANFESTFLSENESLSSSVLLGQFLTLFGLGNLLALLSTTIWFSVRLSPIGLMSAGVVAMLFAHTGGYLFSSINPNVYMQGPSIFMAVGSLLIVESLYPVVVQSNMMNVLSTLPITTQRQARAIIESFAEAIGLGISALFIESPYATATSFSVATGTGCMALFILCAYLHLRQKRMREDERPSEILAEEEIETAESINTEELPEITLSTPCSFEEVSDQIESIDEEYTDTSAPYQYDDIPSSDNLTDFETQSPAMSL